MNPIKGAVAGAVGGACGAYTMELFQAWWNDTEKRLAPKRRAHAARDTAETAAQNEPATVRVAERVAKTVLDTDLPEELKPIAGETVHYTTGATIGAVYGAIAEIVPPARMFNGLVMGAAVWWLVDNTLVPAQKLGTPPEKTPPSVHTYALASHLVYGFTTELVRSIVRLVI